MQTSGAKIPAPDGAFELPPPLPPRKVEWRRAARLLRELVRDPAQAERVFELFQAAGGRGDEPMVQRIARDPAGARLFRDRPLLLPRLVDRDALASLPSASFGRAYLAFAERNGFAADGLVEANDRGSGGANADLDPDRRWFFERVTLVHDLWHVLTAYDTDGAGEVALLGFSYGQGLASRTIKLLLVTTLALAPKREGLAFQRFVREAVRRGRRAAPLFVARYEELLPRPLADVRRELRIEPFGAAHPNGYWTGDPLAGFVRVAA